MSDPLAQFWRHPVTVTRRTGTDAYGRPSYSPPTTERAWIDDTRRVVRGPDGDEVISETTVYLPIDTDPVPLHSTITLPPVFESRTTTVLAVSRHDGAGLPTPDHLELALA